MLTAALLLFSSTAFAQPARIAIPQPATSALSSSAFERGAAIAGDVGQERRLSPGPIIGMICAIVASSVALGVAFGLRRRIDRIAGPDPEKEDND
jgi:hypothetical protein